MTALACWPTGHVHPLLRCEQGLPYGTASQSSSGRPLTRRWSNEMMPQQHVSGHGMWAEVRAGEGAHRHSMRDLCAVEDAVLRVPCPKHRRKSGRGPAALDRLCSKPAARCCTAQPPSVQPRLFVGETHVNNNEAACVQTSTPGWFRAGGGSHRCGAARSTRG